MKSRESLNGIDEENNLEEALEPTPACCIYRVPEYIRKLNEDAYTPRLISIGPLHHGKKKLMGMENKKERCWSNFVERVDARKVEEVKTYIAEEEKHIRDHYLVTSNLESAKYVKMVRYDAFFIIEFFTKNYRKNEDFFLKNPKMRYDLTNDLLLLENQLPYYVLNDLYTKAYPSTEGNPSFFALCLWFFKNWYNFNWSFSEQPKVEHLTDLLRQTLVKEVQLPVKPEEYIFDLPSATKLNESGLKFRGTENECFLALSLEKRKSRKWLPWFKVNEVRIPCLKIFDSTEILFRNLMIFEVFHYPDQTHTCNYAILMDYLIDTSKDVDLLIEKGIIANYVGDNEAIAKMFNKLCLDIMPGPSCYYGIAVKMKEHHDYPWNHMKATLIRVYFSNLWTGTATIAATFLVILTLIQTVCSIMEVRQGYN
ncbi:hypothetical protein ACOSQ2_003758 [Xanthoceras sorbifolium]